MLIDATSPLHRWPAPYHPYKFLWKKFSGKKMEKKGLKVKLASSCTKKFGLQIVEDALLLGPQNMCRDLVSGLTYLSFMWSCDPFFSFFFLFLFGGGKSWCIFCLTYSILSKPAFETCPRSLILVMNLILGAMSACIYGSR